MFREDIDKDPKRWWRCEAGRAGWQKACAKAQWGVGEACPYVQRVQWEMRGEVAGGQGGTSRGPSALLGMRWSVSSVGIMEQITTTWWLKISETYPFLVVGAKSPKSRCRPCGFFWGAGEKRFHCPSLASGGHTILEVGGYWLRAHLSQLCIHLALASCHLHLSMSFLCLSPERPQVIQLHRICRDPLSR